MKTLLNILPLLLGIANLPAGQVFYDFAGQAGNQASTPVTTGIANVTESDITRSGSLNAAAGVNSMSASGWPTTGSLLSYYTFTLTPDLGYAMTLNSLTFSERRSATGIRDVVVRTSVGAFAADVLNVNVPDDTLTRRQTAVFGAGYAGLVTPLEIRLYGINAESSSGTWRLGISSGADNPNSYPANLVLDLTVSLSSPVQVPEPVSTAMLMGLALGALSLARLRLGRIS